MMNFAFHRPPRLRAGRAPCILQITPVRQAGQAVEAGEAVFVPRNEKKTNIPASIYLRGDVSKFGQGLFQGGLITVHVALGTTEALDAIEILVKGIGGRDKVIQGHVLVA